MRKRCRSTRLEEFLVSREHIFHDTSLDEDMERELEERERTGGAIAPLWTRWLLMNRKQEESRDDDIDAVRGYITLCQRSDTDTLLAVL